MTRHFGGASQNSPKRGSVTAWGHVNMQGEYDFTKHSSNDVRFDMGKILALRVS